MPATRSFSTRSTRTDDQHPYTRPQLPLNRFVGYREKKPPLKDTRKKTSPRVVNSQSLLNPSFSERQTWSKMGTTLFKEVQSSRLADVPKLAEDILPEEAISNGMALAKGDKSFSITFSGIISTIREAPLRISKYIAVNFWRGLREDAVVPETAGVPWLTDTDSTTEAVKVDETNTTSSDKDSQATQLDENTSPVLSSDEDGTKVGDDSAPSTTTEIKEDKNTEGKGKKKAGIKAKKPLSSEEHTCIFLNRIADQIRETFGIKTNDPNRRVFSARFKDKAPDDAPVNCIRKPDCAVLDYNVAVADKAYWSDVHSLIEIKKSNAVPVMKDAYNELLNCARMVFAAQHNRRFILGATIAGADMIFFVFDRSGVVGSKTIDINEEPEFLIRVICGLIFVDDIRLGFDKTIEKKDEGGYTIKMNGIAFDCDEPMYIEKAVRGRGTGCFRTMHKGEEAVIKDSWVDDSRKRLEHEILDKIKDVEGVVRVIDHEIVQVEGKDDSTSVARRRLAEDNLWKDDDQWEGFNLIEARTHRRIMMKPYGQPLESFASLKELMQAIKDIVKVVEDLVERKVLHRDISLRNLILARSDPNDPNSRIRGYLIDFDYALDLENISEDVAKGARTGTLPFMAIEMLVEETSNRVPHAYYHDLESIFYSLCWICTSQEGPNDTPRSSSFNFSEAEVSKWNGVGMDNPTIEEIQRFKASTVQSKTNFSIRVLRQFAPYFESLKPCIAALKDVMVGENSNMDDLDPFYRKEIEATIRKLDEARQKGEPLDKALLGTIPICDRDYRDVFRSIYEIIDQCISELKEPVIPEVCKKKRTKKPRKAKKPTREQIDDGQPRGIRELVDGNAEAKAYRIKAVIDAKNREQDENDGIEPPTDASKYIPNSGLLFCGQSQPGPSEPTDVDKGKDVKSVLDESDVPSQMGDQGMESTDNLPSFGMGTYRPGDRLSSASYQYYGLPATVDSSSGLMASPVIGDARMPPRTKRSSRDMPPPSRSPRAKQSISNERSRASTPVRREKPPPSPPPSSLCSASTKRSASEFEDDEPGQRTPFQMSPPKKQKLS